MANFYGRNMNQNSFGYPSLSAFSNTLPTIHGRKVNGIEDIMPNEIPMDGTVSLFPKSDFSCIFAKQWNSDGTISTVTFVPYSTNAQSSNRSDDISKHVNNEFNEIVLKNLSDIKKMLSQQNNYRGKPYNRNFNKTQEVKKNDE